jgi:apolipoprotein D and lipocalin family protein
MKNSRTLLVLAALAVAGFATACATRSSTPLRTTPFVDLKRYVGKWYEIASYPVWFQRRCAGGTTAEYSANPDGSIQVLNRCYDKNGKPIEALGRAKVVPGSGNAKLKVSFFGPFTGDYYVIGLDENNYSWALVGHPSRKYLWILSRTPQMDAATYDKIVALAVAQGYDPALLKKTDQSRHLR